MKCRRCPKCFQYMKKRKSRNVPVNFWCRYCRVWANSEYYTIMIGRLFMIRWINGTTEIRPLRTIRNTLMVDGPILIVNRVLPMDLSLDKIKLLLTFS